MVPGRTLWCPGAWTSCVPSLTGRMLVTSSRGGEIRYVSRREWRSPLSCSCGTCTWGKAERDGNGEGRTNPLLSLQTLIALPYAQNSSPGTMEAQGLSQVLC